MVGRVIFAWVSPFVVVTLLFDERLVFGKSKMLSLKYGKLQNVMAHPSRGAPLLMQFTSDVGESFGRMLESCSVEHSRQSRIITGFLRRSSPPSPLKKPHVSNQQHPRRPRLRRGDGGHLEPRTGGSRRRRHSSDVRPDMHERRPGSSDPICDLVV